MSTPRLAAIGFFLLTAAAATANATEHEVTQRDGGFSRDSVIVQAGDAVVIKNDDTVAHNILSKSAGLELNELQQPGDQTKVVFKDGGQWVIRCAIHPKAKLTVNVQR